MFFLIKAVDESVLSLCSLPKQAKIHWIITLTCSKTVSSVYFFIITGSLPFDPQFWDTHKVQKEPEFTKNMSCTNTLSIS